MATANISNTLVVPAASKVFPYFDDFNEDKNYHRILFRPGYGLQARELTKVQTILQNQIERFGNHIFKNGSSVIGGKIFVEDGFGYSVNLSSSYINNDIDVTQFNKKIVVLDGDDQTIKFKVEEVSAGTSNTPPALFGRYLSTSTFTENQTIKVLNDNIYANAASANVTATCRLATVKDGVFFFNGYFVKVPTQTTAFSRYNEQRANAKIGLAFSDTIITENEDSSLLDPALESYNYQGPGAARYQVNLTLTSRTLDSEDVEKFVELARFEEGNLRSLTEYPVYGEIEEVLARRTYDQSGNFTVRPYVASFDIDRFDPLNYVAVNLSPGKSYVQGYEYETISDTVLRVPKAKTTQNVSNYDLNMNYGNYVVTSNLKGDFGVTTMDLFDIHCLPYDYIDFTSNATYQTSKTGTARVKAIEFYSGDVDVDSRKYEFYLFDTRWRSIASNASYVSTNTIRLFNGTTLLSANNDVYQNAVLRVTSGPGVGYSYNIAAYNASTRTITIDADQWISTPTTSSNVAIEFDFNDSHSFVKRVGYTPGATSNANTNITTLNKVGGINDAATFINESSLDTLVFSLPDEWIANGITSQSYSYTKKYSSVQFTNGTLSSPISAGTNEDFQGTTTSSNTSSTVMNNFLVIISDKQSSGRNTGDVVKVRSTVTAGSPEQANFDTDGGVGDSFVATIYAKMQFDPGVTGKIKSLSPANTATFSAESPSTTFVNSSGSNTTVYINAGQVVIKNPTKTVGVTESLYISDVIAVSKIYDLNGQSVPSGGSPLYIYDDVTDRFEFNNGQRDNYYDHASIKLKPDYAPVKGPLIVCCRYYNHTSISGQGEYFTVDSYPNLGTEIFEEGTSLGDGYSMIPDFVSSSGKKISLRDSIDFRAKRSNASNTAPNFTLTGIKVPDPTTDFQLNYSYYLGRRDLIVVNSEKTISRIEGIPSKSPQEPSVPSRSMVIYSLGIQPYTKYPANVSAKYIENKRYTMRDIGKIEKRVENIEYYIGLNTLEKDALDITIRDVNGLDRTKYGVLADTFKGHKLGASDRIDYQCSMNFTEGWLQCQSNTTSFKLTANSALSSNVTFMRDKIILNYGEKPFVSQNVATKYAPVAEMLHAAYRGRIFTMPEADNWKSVNTAPDIILTDTANSEYSRVQVYQSTVDSQSRA